MKPINTYVVPVLNNLTGLKKLCESLYKYTPHNFRIIVIFNGTQEDFVKAQAEIPTGDGGVHVWIKPYKNLGFAKSMNYGIQIADTEFVTLANDDVEVIYDTWWQETEQLFRDKPELFSFNPHSFINKRHTGDRAIQYELKDEYTKEDIAEMKKIFHAERWYTGGCTFFTICKREVFKKIGLFDESFGLGSGEDYDMCVRAAKAGFLMAGGSVVMVKHWWGATKDNLPVDLSFTSNYDLIAKGNQNMERKWGPHVDKDPNGWTVGGRGGPDIPLDKDNHSYPNDGWYDTTPL